MSKSKITLPLVLILVLAAGLRLWHLSRADVITDESLIAIRSIGYIDFFASPNQTTPYEWFSVIPAWAKLSFHDHPPLTFLISNLFFKIFGQNLLALRLPFALAGIFSVFLIYLLAKILFNRQTGLLVALLLAICNYSVWISRIGLQESLVICFSLLTFYLFWQSLQTGRHWQWGITLGLAVLVKYTAFIILPIIIIYLLIFNRLVFRNKRFYLALIVIILIFSPVLIYNFKMFGATGHFDLQFSYLFGQKTSEWQNLVGKEQIGSFGQRIINLPLNLYYNLSLPEFVLIIFSSIFSVYLAIKEKSKSLVFLLIIILFHGLLFLLIGSSQRFVAVIIPYLLLAVAYILVKLDIFKFKVSWILLLIFALFQLFFCYNSTIANYSIEPKVLAADTRREVYSWGYSQLNDYVTKLLENKKPEVSLQTRYQFLEDIKKQALLTAENENKKSAAMLLIYDADMYDLATLWIFHRQLIYSGWPIITADTYLSQPENFWQSQGIKDFYFFKIIDPDILQQPEDKKTDGALSLAGQLKEIKPEIIKRPDGREVFAVYHWQ